MASTCTVLLVEDHALLRAGLKASLETFKRYSVIGEAGDGESAVREAHRLQPQCVLMDVGLPNMNGVEATWRIKQDLPRTRVVMFTSHTEPADVTAALGAGADGYCAKDTPIEQIVNAIDTVMRGEVWLDPTIADSVMCGQLEDNSEGGIDLSNIEVQVLSLIKEGLDNRELAARLHISMEVIGRVMHGIIHRFTEKATAAVVEPQVQKQGSFTEWFAATTNSINEETIFAEKYQIEHAIGEGGLGMVFKAKHLLMNRTVAIKLLHPEFSEDPRVMRTFQREAKSVASLQHPNIVGVYDFGISQKRVPFLVMEYVPGRDLASILDATPRLSMQRVINLCLQICAGLAEANAKGIIHCDLKPSNILVLGSDPDESVKLVDFGLAQIIPRTKARQSQMTDKFFVDGTPTHMAPEQISGKQLDTRTDIYALGCIMFEALTGVNVFKGETAMETFAKHLELTAPSMASVYPEGDYPPLLQHVVRKMLEKDPARRPQSMEEVINLLRAVGKSASASSHR